MADSELALIAPLKLALEGQTLLSEPRIRLLEAIERYGSLNQAAKSLPMSYKAAWDALDSMNNLADEALVIRQSGGRHGGGSVLTDAGKQLVSVYRALQLEYQQSLQELQQLMAKGAITTDLDSLRQLLRRMHFRSSARNQLSGVVREVRRVGVKARVLMQFGQDPALVLHATVTDESIRQLELAEGVRLLALVKAPQVKVIPFDPSSALRANHYQGRIERLCSDQQSCQVQVAVSEYRGLSALISRACAKRYALTEGMTVEVSFAPSSVVLCRYD